VKKGLIFLAVMLFLASLSPSISKETPPDPLKPINLFKIDFAVPWGLRYGQSVRIYFQFDVDEKGMPLNIKVLKSKPHDLYNYIAKTSLKKYRYPAGKARENLIEEAHFCVLSDHVSTFACKIEFHRLDVDQKKVAKNPDDAAFYYLDKFAGFPKVRKYVIPEYPMQAARKVKCGWVVAEFNLSKGGKPKHIKITSSSHVNLFSLSVRDALTGFRFERGTGEEKVKYKISFGIPGKCEAEDLTSVQ